MKVILLKELKGKGGEGDVVEVAKGYANNYLFINKIAASQGKISVRRRVAGWLLHKVRVENTPELEDGITREVLAGLLGLSRESLCRQLGQFSREGVIRLERKRITVLDLQALRRSLEG